MKRLLAMMLSALLVLTSVTVYADVATPPEAGDTGSGDTGDSGSGDTGDTGSGDTGDSGSGDTGDTGSGDTGDSGSGDTDADKETPAPEKTPTPEETPSPEATPSPTPTPDDTLLKKGSEGDAVTQLQKRLTELGYYTGPITGHFGDNTSKAVKSFQRANNLSADGVVGPKTRAVLNSSNAIPKSEATYDDSDRESSRGSSSSSSIAEYYPIALEVEATPRPTYEYDETQVVVQADGYEIPATVTVPLGQNDEQFPCVVMCHGYGSNRHEAGNGYDILAPLLAKNGIATIRYDYKGCGDSQQDYIDFTFPDAIEEAMLCYEYMTARSDINNMAMGIMGWSMGGGVALLTAGQYDMFDSVLTWAGACYDGTISQEEYETAKSQGYYEATFDWRDPLKQSPAYYESLMALDVEAAVANINAPILAINGTEDTTVPPETAEKIVKASGNPQSETYLLQSADHTFNIFSGDMKVFDELCDVTVEWFVNTLYGA